MISRDAYLFPRDYNKYNVASDMGKEPAKRTQRELAYRDANVAMGNFHSIADTFASSATVKGKGSKKVKLKNEHVLGTCDLEVSGQARFSKNGSGNLKTLDADTGNRHYSLQTRSDGKQVVKEERKDWHKPHKEISTEILVEGGRILAVRQSCGPELLFMDNTTNSW